MKKLATLVFLPVADVIDTYFEPTWIGSPIEFKSVLTTKLPNCQKSRNQIWAINCRGSIVRDQLPEDQLSLTHSIVLKFTDMDLPGYDNQMVLLSVIIEPYCKCVLPASSVYANFRTCLCSTSQ